MDLRGRRVIVTGASSGVGLACVEKLVARGAHVVMAVRDVPKAHRSAAKFPKDSVTIRHVDLSDRGSIERFAKETVNGEFGEVSILINNAGTLETKASNKDGVETTLLTNHIGPSYLTQLLLPVLGQVKFREPDVRVVNVGSRLEKNAALDYNRPFLELLGNGSSANDKFSGWLEYANSKNMNLLSTNALQRRHPTIQFNTVTPGMVNTSLSRNYSSWFLYLTYAARALLLKTPAAGADAVVYAATSREVKTGGSFLGDAGVALPHSRQHKGQAEEEAALSRTLEIIEYWQRRIVK